MKKILFSVLLTAFMSTNIWAASVEGEVTIIQVKSNGNVLISINGGTFKTIEASNLGKQELIALLLTAKTSSSTVKVFHDSGIVYQVNLK